MITDDVLDKGITRGVVTSQQVMELKAIAREIDTRVIPEPQDDEKLRFITGFNDIFVTIGIGLFSVAIGYFASQFAGQGGFVIALVPVSWVLAEYFTRKRRMALPSIVLLCLFTGSVFLSLMAAIVIFKYDYSAFEFLLTFRFVYKWEYSFILLAAFVTAILVSLHYIRFRVPITIAAVTAALSGSMIALMFSVVPDFSKAHTNAIITLAGVSIFALAMRFDLSDPARVTRRTDIAFWLHMLAAPMIVHSLILSLIGDEERSLTLATAGSILAIFFMLAVISVIIDRRAMLVSGLTYAGYASATFIKQIGMSNQTLPITLLTLGAFILLLSAGWRPVRGALLKLLPVNLAQKLPHPILSS